jgi:hypothetical protein
LILCSVVYRDATRQAKGLYGLKHVGALSNGLAYLSRYNSGLFCHSNRPSASARTKARPRQAISVCGLAAPWAGPPRAAAPQLYPRTPEPRAPPMCCSRSCAPAPPVCRSRSHAPAPLARRRQRRALHAVASPTPPDPRRPSRGGRETGESPQIEALPVGKKERTPERGRTEKEEK